MLNDYPSTNSAHTPVIRCGGRGAQHASATAEAAPAAVVRLDLRTFLDEAHYAIKLRDYGGGYAEIGYSFVPALRKACVARGTSENRDKNEKRACNRASSKIRHLVLASGADHLLTLTYRENITDLAQAEEDLERFVRLVKASYPDWRYIAVPEKQTRGAWHWHLAVCGWQDIGCVRAAWRHCVGEGNIDVQPPKGPREKRRFALVRYLTKYLVKGFQEGHELNRHRYRRSQKIEDPVVSLSLPASARVDVVGFVIRKLCEVAGGVGHQWQSEDQTAGWACSW